jgi:molybdopterin synthase catalytic subunit
VCGDRSSVGFSGICKEERAESKINKITYTFYKIYNGRNYKCIPRFELPNKFN